MARHHVFGARRPRLLRTHIPPAENFSVALVGLVLIGLLAWVVGTRDDFDPAERDLPFELQLSSAREIPIYTPPLKHWVDPAQPVGAPALDLAPFPPETLDSDWQPVGRVKRFQADNLYEKINGEAEKFIKQGFVALGYLLLRSTRDGGEIALELFDQGDLAGSLGVFGEHAAGRTVQEADGVSFFTTQAGVIGRVDRYFFRAAGDRTSEHVSRKALDLVSAFGGLAGAAPVAAIAPELPPGFQLLNKGLGIPEKQIQFQENNAFQYEFARRFWFGELDNGARVFLHIAEDAQAAEALLAALMEEQRIEYEEVAGGDGLTSLRHRFLDTYFVVSREARYLFGLEELADPGEAAPWLARIREGLRHAE